MPVCELTTQDQRVLSRIQSGFPLAEKPYEGLAHHLGATAGEVHRRVLALRRNGVIRRIGGSYAASPLGYLSTLVGSRVAPARVAEAAAVAGAFPEVTHNYEREGALNLWFTVVAQDAPRLQHILQSVRQVAGVEAVYDLPCRRVFKIRVEFRFGKQAADEEDRDASPTPAPPRPSAPVALDEVDRRVIARTCGDIGESPTPFAELGRELGIPPSALLQRLQRLLRNGAMRRFGAMLRHRVAGIVGNGMSVWNVPDEQVPTVGRALAGRPEISHCYERPRIPDWPYNVFAMIHAEDKETCFETAAEIADEVGIADYRLLSSGREFKKSSMVYFPDALRKGAS